MDRYVSEGMGSCGSVNCLEKHRSSMLIEEFGCRIDVVISARIWPSDHHHRHPGCLGRGRMIDAVVVDRRLEKVCILFEPV